MASFSQSEEQHVKHLNWVIGALNQVNLKLGKRNAFGYTKLTILAHIISGNAISADPLTSAFQKLVFTYNWSAT